jgi:O-antigen/teichoic acid export membrane protein
VSDVPIGNPTMLDGSACAAVRSHTLASRLAAFASSAPVRSLSAQAFALIDQGCLSASTFATTALLAHTAGFADLGTFSIAWMFILLVNAIQVAVVTAPMASLVPAESAEIPRYHAYYIGLEGRFLGIVLASALAVAAVSLLTGTPRPGLVIPALAALGAYQVFDFVRRFAHATARHLDAALLSAAVTIVQFAVLVKLRAASLLTVESGFAAIALVMGAFSLLAAWRVLPCWIGLRGDRTLGERSWQSSRWLLGSAVMHWTCGNIFVLLSPAYVGLGGTGALRAAQSIVGVVNIWYLGLENIMPLRAGQLWRGAGPWQAARFVGGLSLLWTAVTGVFVALVFYFADPLLLAVYGPQAEGYRGVLQWFAALQLLIFLALPLRSLLRAAEDTRGIFFGFVAATIFSVAAVWPLLHMLGLIGVLVGLTCAQCVFQAVLAWHLWRRFRQFNVDQSS